MDLVTYAINKKYTDKKISALSEDIKNLSTGGSGGVSSWNDLTDKPFGVEMSEGIPEFDCDMTGKETVEYSSDVYFVKISDRVFTEEELLNSTITLTAYVDLPDYRITAGRHEYPITLSYDSGAYIVIACGFMWCYVVYEETPQLPLSCGTWYVCAPGMLYTNSISCVHAPAETVKKLDEKFLPESVGGVSSWNDLADKPFGETVKEINLIPESGLTKKEEGQYVAETTLMPTVGNTYTVTYNGTAYSVIAIAPGEGIFCMGNTGMAGLGEDTGEPFLAMFRKGDFAEPGQITFVVFDGASEVNVTIKGLDNVVKKLDDNFYDGTVYYYIERSPDASDMKRIYNDYYCRSDSEVTVDELKQAIGKTVVLIDAYNSYRIQYTATSIDLSNGWYGKVVIVYTDGSDIKTSTYYTAEYH